eukprot:Partr_v1_DN28295_c1_g1_i1_m76099 putative Unc51-like kinase
MLEKDLPIIPPPLSQPSKRASGYAAAYQSFSADVDGVAPISPLNASYPTSGLSSLDNSSSFSGFSPFKKTSIFFSGSGAAVDLPDVPEVKSRNSIFSEDFSVTPSHSRHPSMIPSSAQLSAVVPSSKNDIFFQDFSASPSSLSESAQASAFEVSPTRQNLQLNHSLPSTASHRSASSASSSHPRPSSCISDIHTQVFATPTTSPTSQSLVPTHSQALTRHPSLLTLRDQLVKVGGNGISYIATSNSRIGEGRYAVVYKGSYGSPGNDTLVMCAVKCLHANDCDAQNNGVAEAYVLETIRKWSNGGHPNIIRLLATEQEDGVNLILALEYCQNGTLADFITLNAALCGRRKFMGWSKQLAGAVEFLQLGHVNGEHRSAIIHHDIKPHNILLDNNFDIRLSDFGSASIFDVPVDADGALQTCNFIDGLGRGTQAYSPPEILTPPDFVYSLATDIYSMGCTFYFLLTGRDPFMDLRNPSHQLWCIRRGFIESGANPFTSISSSTPTSPLATSLSLQPRSFTSAQKISAHSPVAREPSPLALFRFLNGETLHSDVDNDMMAYTGIMTLLKKCTALEPQSRPSATNVVSMLHELDNLLILGTGFDDSYSRRSATNSRHNSISDDSSSTVTRVNGGRRGNLI